MNLAFLALSLPMTCGAGPVLPPPPVPSAFTFVKVTGPGGSKVVWYPGTQAAAVVPNEAAVGLRPGYYYRFELSGLGPNKTEKIYPSMEVRGSLIMRPGFNVAEHPVPIILTDEDVIRILEGRYLSKVYFLEDPEKSVNGAVIGVPVEIGAAHETEAIKEARDRGRIMIVFRAGERVFTPQELVRENVPGTILFPGTTKLPMPGCPPLLNYSAIPLFDPLIGPRSPGARECLADGGDSNRPLAIGRESKVYGLDPSDTAIEFSTASGRKVATSNRVCICVPRYAAMRTELNSLSFQGIRGPQINVQAEARKIIKSREPAQAVIHLEQPIGATGQTRPSGTIGEVVVIARGTVTGKPAAIATLNGTKVAATIQEVEDLTVYPDRPILQKRVEPAVPKQIGEIVTFYLRFFNPTNQPMTDVVISDSLTGRLEYLEGSSASDRATTFTATPNEAGSYILRWAIDGPLAPGQSGTIRFKARIR